MNIDRKGFTLIEIVVAMALMSLGLLALYGMQVTVMKSNSSSKNITTATLLAETKMEGLKNTGFGNNTTGYETNIDEAGQAGGIFTRSWQIDPNYQNSANMEKVTVTVTWSDQNRTHNISLKSVLSKLVD
ncbi:prepilin-type N-terminal cleavage/methylation domain-containing protein [bacterium]|nr:prepilin-type N-terminal cleavage/methylation domain-containing protein [bacterium]